MADPAALSPSEREAAYRLNYRLFMWDFIVFTVGMGLLGPSTVIPDFVRGLTDSEIIIGLSGQLFDICWLLPQLLVARRLLTVAHKKWWFVIPNIPVRLLVLALSGVIVLVGGEHKTTILAAFLIFYALAGLGDGLVGVPWLDLMGTSIDDKRRARLFGLGTAVVGVGMIGLNPVVRLILGDQGPDFPNNYALLFAIAGTLFVLTVPPTAFIKELPGATPHDVQPAMRDYLPELARVLRADAPFRAAILARLLVGLWTMASPFYIGFATEQLGMSSSVAVSNLLLMQTLGNVGGSLLLSWLGERHLLLFIRLLLGMAVLQPLLALLASVTGPVPLYVAFIASGCIGGSLMLSFMNWVVIYAGHERRPIYSGLLNSLAAVSLLIAPLLGGLIVEGLGYEAVFAGALMFVIVALAVCLRWMVSPHRENAVISG
ncbi:MAG TPA: MFS transporter [Aggregatilinea sp.]|uniref:MFS transporter n=1 Tax=Aggregatilinea sp. TaxID=2806333 RepID=UPI002C05D236|nr:MFS transporter [Aggregatilinea sp.]HML23592.1 MFS transporter [Aggregatilinea sp.]